LGVGYLQHAAWNQDNVSDSTIINSIKIAPGQNYTRGMLDSALGRNYIILLESKYITYNSYGPEAGIALNFRAGNFAVIRGDYRIRIPIAPLVQRPFKVLPDWDVYTTVSWSLTRSITLDYLLQYTLNQPLDQLAHVDITTQSIFLRWSFNSK
jgi:hypothetical protein